MKVPHSKGTVPPGSKSPGKGITWSPNGKVIYPEPKAKVIHA